MADVPLRTIEIPGYKDRFVVPSEIATGDVKLGFTDENNDGNVAITATPIEEGNNG